MVRPKGHVEVTGRIASAIMYIGCLILIIDK